VPFTVNVNCGPPAVEQVGLSELIVGLALMVITSVALPVLQRPAPLFAVIVTLYVPGVVGVPSISPKSLDGGGVSSFKPGGSPVAV